MSAHKAATRRRRIPRLRALLALGMLLGIAHLSTMASWSDQATITTGTISSGTLDLKVGASSADQLTGQGGTWNYTTLAISDLVPGESIAKTFVVGNGGTTPLKYTGTVKTSSNDLYNLSTPGLQLTVTTGGTASASGSQTTGNRTGSCTGTTTSLNGTSVSTAAVAISPTATTLQPSATTTYCVVAKLATTSPNTMQGKSVTLTFAFDASQPS